jgi:hypothetical protein
MTFTDFFSGLAKVICGLFPILSTVMTVIAPELVVPAQIISALPGLITTAEAALGDGSGPIKKAAVMQGAQLLAKDITDMSTGGQKATWEQYSPMVSVLVDSIVAGVNAVKPGTVVDNNALVLG